MKTRRQGCPPNSDRPARVRCRRQSSIRGRSRPTSRGRESGPTRSGGLQRPASYQGSRTQSWTDGAWDRGWRVRRTAGAVMASTLRPEAGDPIQYDELHIEHDEGDVEIVVYNHAILLFTTDSEAGRRVYPGWCPPGDHAAAPRPA